MTSLGGDQYTGPDTYNIAKSIVKILQETDPNTASDAGLDSRFSVQQVESLAQLTEVGTAYVNKVTITTPVLAAGDYLISYGSSIGNATSTSKTVVRATLDAVDLQECVFSGTGTGEYKSFSGQKFATLTAATHTVEIDFKAGTGTAEIANASIVIRRI